MFAYVPINTHSPVDGSSLVASPLSIQLVLASIKVFNSTSSSFISHLNTFLVLRNRNIALWLLPKYHDKACLSVHGQSLIISIRKLFLQTIMFWQDDNSVSTLEEWRLQTNYYKALVKKTESYLLPNQMKNICITTIDVRSVFY